MTGLVEAEMVLYVGIAISAAAIVGFIIAFISLMMYRKKLNRQLEKEYGKKTD